MVLSIAVLLVGFPSDCQNPTPTRLGPSAQDAPEIPAEAIFSRFADRVVILRCDVTSEDLKQASGVLVSVDGFIGTNAHVAEGCRSMTATLISGNSRHPYEAVLKYYDKKTDTAVLKIEAKDLGCFDLLARAVRIGERVYTIGNPRGLEQSISEGIVSGLRTEEDGTLWIQHSAPISPGSSGGALISSRGELLGINSWFWRESQGLNFAVPTSTLRVAYETARALPGSLKFPVPRSPDQAEVVSPHPPPGDRIVPKQPPSGVSGTPSGHGSPRSGESLVRLNVTVMDRSGRRVTDLSQEAFTVMEGGVPQEIKVFKHESVPVSLGLIIDNSAGMREQRPAVESSAFLFVHSLTPPDEAFIVNYNDQAFLDKDFTSDVNELQEGLSRIDSRGGTAMREAVRMSIDHLRERARQDKKVLVLLTGGDDDSSLISINNLTKSAQDSGVLMYAMGLLSGGKKGKVNKRPLEALAEATGGAAYFPKGSAEVERRAAEIVRDIRDQYTIAYAPTDQHQDGSFRKISVVVKGSAGMVARTRRGYYAVARGQ